MRAALLALVVCLGVGCASHAPASLSGAGLTAWKADQVVVAFGTAQHAAIALNGIPVCDTATPPVCHPLLSDSNTRVVVDATTDTLTTIKATPDGWRATALAACDRIDARLDANGKQSLKVYVAAVRALIGGLQ